MEKNSEDRGKGKLKIFYEIKRQADRQTYRQTEGQVGTQPLKKDAEEEAQRADLRD